MPAKGRMSQAPIRANPEDIKRQKMAMMLKTLRAWGQVIERLGRSTQTV